MINDTDLNFAVRIIGLRSASIDIINEFFEGIDYTDRPYFKDKKLRSISVSFNENINLLPVIKVLKKCEGAYLKADVFISLSSGVETQILDFPDFANKAIASLGLDITLSYTVFSDFDC